MTNLTRPSKLVLWFGISPTEVINLVIISYMKTQQTPTDWWHERPLKAQKQHETRLMPLVVLKDRGDKSVWKEGALVVGLVFSFGLTMISMLAR